MGDEVLWSKVQRQQEEIKGKTVFKTGNELK